MRLKLIVILIITATMITACGKTKAPVPTPDNQGPSDTENRWEQVADLPEIELNYVSIPVERLTEGNAEEGWILIDSVNLRDLEPTLNATIRLYEVRSQGSNEPTGIIYAFLEDATAMYEIGEVGVYGIEDIRITVENRIFKGKKTVEIVGGKGATYEELRVLGYNDSTNEWVNLLVMGSPFKADIDGNGEEELLAESAGTVPGYVQIYRWADSYFEKADITVDAYSNFATLYNQDGQWLIETGTFENGEVVEIRIYKFNNGVLEKVE